MGGPDTGPGETLDSKIAWLNSREDYRILKAQYEEVQARRNPPELPILPLPEAVKEYDAQPAFDIARGVTTFLDGLGVWASQPADAPNSELGTTVTENIISRDDFALLCSVLPSQKRGALDSLPRSPGFQDTPIQLKARLLDTLARLALHPALTHPVIRAFSPLHLDLAARWLVSLGYEATAFSASAADAPKDSVLAVLTAFARLMKDYPGMYPFFLILIRHPHFQTDSPFTFLSDLPAGFLPPNWPSSALKPVEDPSALVFHPDLPRLLLILQQLLEAVPYFPLMPSVVASYGSPVPPIFLLDIMSSHPLAYMRILAWRTTNAWLGWDGPCKRDMWETYVYNPELDPQNNHEGLVLQNVPAPDLSKQPGDGEEWLAYWRKVVRATWSSREQRLQMSLEQPFIDVWIYQAEVSSLEELAVRARVYETPSSEEGMTEDTPPSSPPSLPYTPDDVPHLLVEIERISLLREICLPIADAASSRSQAAVPHPQVDTAASQDSTFVRTTSAVSVLRQLAICAATRVPVLLGSPAAAGKATILNELHRQLYSFPGLPQPRDRQIVSINLADRSLDAKTLLGSLASSPTEPGTFVFVEGTLTRALRHGRWLVLEDIDKAADDVLSTVAELVERIRNRVESFVGGGYGGAGKDAVGVQAGGEWVEAAEGFMLFATRSFLPSSSDAGAAAAPTFFGNQYWTSVWLDLPTADETREIVQGCFPRLSSGVVGQLVSVWQAVQAVANSPTGSSGGGMARQVGIRDLMIWCKRVQAILPAGIDMASIDQNPVFQDEVCTEARDVFLGSFPSSNIAPQTSPTKYAAVVSALQEGLLLSSERMEWLLQGRIPELIAPEDDQEHLRIGRAVLRRIRRKRPSAEKSRPYALSRPFLGLLEKLAVCVQSSEPVLMVGETGTGKTAAVGHLAERVGRRLVALNLSNQTEASDLLGGFKPINEAEELDYLALNMVNQFTELFSKTFSLARNAEYSTAVMKAYKKKNWTRLVGLWREAHRMAGDRLSAKRATMDEPHESPRKKRKVGLNNLSAAWQAFLNEVSVFAVRTSQQESKASRFTFKFVEGPLVRALQEGDWVLLDEVNLATPETLESLSTLLSSSDASLVLTERGDVEPVHRHPDFRLFACMNPATDIGKKDLPPALRAKFTELYVAPPDSDRDTLISIVQGYIGHAAVGDRGVVLDVAEFYLAIKALASAGQLADGSNQPPHFSMRTLARALTFAADMSSTLGIRRGIYEGCTMAFTTLLEEKSNELVTALLQKYLVDRAKNSRSFLSTPFPKPSHPSAHVCIGSFWLAKGHEAVTSGDDYVLTASVQAKLVNIARTVAAGRFPVLIQGPTSAGKTSIIEYLAGRTGHRFVRINNHEHTDIQEYLGTYVSDPHTGKLVFREGILVKAVRNGDWLVLDELNLAPTDVLEALNRLLDDNRELVIPETQEVVKPHPHFMLFATQNPPGLYGGRKFLSRAFRNRFLEMHFSDVPKDELATILCQRCKIAPSYAKKIVQVFLELQKRRQSTRVFEEKQAFVTLRDLFRWGGRGAVGYDELATDGYMLLAERARKLEDKEIVKDVLEVTLKVKLDEQIIYNAAFQKISAGLPLKSDLVWTSAMRRLFVLVHAALSHHEPVLLVGETGSGKTSVCQSVADVRNTKLHTVNCHQNTETADLLGSQRPIRNRAALQESLAGEAFALLQQHGKYLPPETDYESLVTSISTMTGTASRTTDLLNRMQQASSLFVWHDGPLVHAMKEGSHILLDEISLADDSVLERLNSVLEPARTLVIAEKGAEDLAEVKLEASEGFEVLATMNPGGDYGKKELSPALRNRFTEIWVPWVTDQSDLVEIIQGRQTEVPLKFFAPKMLDFALWLTKAIRPSEPAAFGSVVTLRDILGWTDFMGAYQGDAGGAFVHGALMTLVDAVGSTSATSGFNASMVHALRARSVEQLVHLSGTYVDSSTFLQPPTSFAASAESISISPFSLRCGAYLSARKSSYALAAPTTLQNARKVLRALQLPKPVLLEGSPGVGKTSLVAALANIAGYRLCRINLSDQTDLIDLFGSDLPVEGGKSGEFAWKDAPFLAAMQAGDWVLLDEMNLASQAVLEGLNSCLDHRGSVFIPELDRVFSRHPSFRIFAAQNPANQGGARKGLPRSFVDRFTQVYMDDLSPADYSLICRSLYPAVEGATVDRMVRFATDLNTASISGDRFAQQGSPWEINLRDLLRWLERLSSQTGLERHPLNPLEYLDPLFIQRFRGIEDQQYVKRLSERIFKFAVTESRPGRPVSDERFLRIGPAVISRQNTIHSIPTSYVNTLVSHSLRPLQALATALTSSSLAVITGPQGSGKSRLVYSYVSMTGQPVQSFFMNSQTDTLEMLGSFEQASIHRTTQTRLRQINILISASLRNPAAKPSWALLSSISKHLRDIQTYTLDSSVVHGLVSRLVELGTTNQVCAEIAALLRSLHASLLQRSFAGRFEWLDGVLVRAMQEGALLLIENANLCNSSVLDRLNALFEPDGELLLTERGMVHGNIVQVPRHPDFRVVMTVDPKFGELSRAMRNRGIEIALLAKLDSSSFDHRRAVRKQILSRLDATLPRFTVPNNSKGIPRVEQAEVEHIIGGTMSDDLFASARRSRRRQCGRSDVLLELRQHPLVTASIMNRRRVFGSSELPAPLLLCQDSNSALKLTAEIDHIYSKNMDMAVSLQIGTLHEHLRVYAVVQPALRKPVRDLTVGEQSAINALHPSRLQQLPMGVATIYPLQVAMLQTLRDLITSIANRGAPESEAIALLARQLYEFLLELTRLAQPQRLDYATYQTLLAWISDSLANAPSVWLQSGTARLRSAVHSAQEALVLITGVYQTQIWKHFLPSRASERRLDMLRESTKRLAGTCSMSVIPADLFEVYTEIMRKLAHATPADTLMYEGIVTELQKKLRQYAGVTGQAPIVISDTLLNAVAQLHHIVEDGLVVDQTGSLPVKVATLVGGCDLDMASSFPSARDGYCKIEGLVGWSRRLTRPSDLAQSTDFRTSDLMSPVLLTDALSLKASLHTLSLQYLSQGKGAHLRAARAHHLIAANVTGVRMEDMSRVLSIFIGEVVTAILPNVRLERLDSVSACFGQLANLIENDKDLITALGQRLVAALTELAGCEVSLSKLGHTYLTAAMAFWSAYVPNIPIDPTVASSARSSFLKRLKEKQTASAVIAEAATGHPGGRGTCTLDEIVGNILQLDAMLADIEEAAVPLRDQPEVLTAVFSELEQCAKTILDHAQIETLEQSLRDGHANGLAQAMNVLDALRAISARLTSLFYLTFEDILRPIMIALSLVSIGIDLLVHQASRTAAGQALESHEAVLGLVCSFPTAPTLSRLASFRIPQSISQPTRFPLLPSQAILLRLFASLSSPASCPTDPRDADTQTLVECYDQAYQLWATDRRREAEAQAEAESIYRARKEEILIPSDEEAESAELAALFPTFEREAEPQPEPVSRSYAAKPASLLPVESMRLVYQVHCRLYGNDTLSRPSLSGDIAKLHETVVRRMLEFYSNSADERIDAISQVYRISLLCPDIAPITDTTQVNFYQDPNIKEAALCAPILDNLVHAIDALIEAWPEQMVLQEIRDRCQAVLSISTNAPVARFLTMIESLLLKLEDWEGYASRETSLKTHQAHLVELVVSWRRLELQSWAKLLEAEEIRLKEPVTEYWFRFYEAFIRASQEIDTTNTTQVSTYLKDVVAFLEDIMTKSPVGQFGDRLSLVQSFAKFVASLPVRHNPLLAPIASILGNTYMFYRERGMEIESHLRQERTKLSSEVQQTIRLASWKDVNVLALRQSALRSHRQLYKAVRKLRTSLKRPANDFLSLTTRNNSETFDASIHIRFERVPLVTDIPTLADSIGLPAAVDNLQRSVKRLRSIVHDYSPTLHDTVEGLSSMLMQRLTSLQEEKPKGKSKEEIAKSVSALTTRKRRAWADLLKELKRIGLSHRPNPITVLGQQDSSIIYRTPPLAFQDSELVKSAHKYFYGLIASLPAVRKSPSSHHDDISSAQLALAVGSIESCMAIALRDHGRLHAGDLAYTELQIALAHMGNLKTSEEGLAQLQFANTDERVTEVCVCLATAHETIREALNAIRSHGTLALDDLAARTDADCIMLLTQAQGQLQGILTELRTLSTLARRSGLLSTKDAASLLKAEQILSQVVFNLQTSVERWPRLGYILQPVLAAVREQLGRTSSPTRQPITACATANAVTRAHSDLIGYVLVLLQDWSARSMEEELTEDGDFIDGGLLKGSGVLQRNLARLRVPEIWSRLSSFLEILKRAAVQTDCHALAQQLLDRVLAVLSAYATLVANHMTAHLAWYRSVMKLNYILVNITSSLSREGFCKPADGEEQAGEGTQTGEGTGMGAGKGNKNVSNEIEEEQQVEGLQDEEEDAQDEPEEAEPGDTVDMSEDFGGKTEDIPENDEDDTNEKEEEDEDDQEDPQEEVGDVDSLDPTAVDDKFWGGDGDDKPEEEDKNNEQTNQQPQETGESEMGERKDRNKQADGKDGEEANSPDEVPLSPEVPDDNMDNANEDGEQMPENEPADPEVNEENKTQDMPDLDSNAEALDLPEDLQLDAPQKEDDALQSDEELDAEPEAANEDSDEADNTEEGDDPTVDPESTEGQGEQDTEAQGMPKPEEESAIMDSLQQSAPNDSGDARGESSAATGASATSDGIEAREEAEDRSVEEAQTANGEATGPSSADPSGSHRQNRQLQKSAEAPKPDHSVEDDAAAEAAGSEDARVETKGSEDRQTEEESQQTARDLGDAAKDWLRRLQAIPDAIGGQAVEPNNDNGNGADIEYTHGDAEEEEMQAAGPAEEEDGLQQRGKGIDQQDIVEEFQAMEVEQMAQPATIDLEHQRTMANEKGHRDAELSAAEMGTALQADEYPAEIAESKGGQLEEEQEDDAIPKQLQAWYDSGRSTLSSNETWRLYENITRELSFGLTEALRLVLEPTLATRLKGDYRTGKRLNMKKIIPYIASDFSKDKIWLRRTRPSQREYQILLSLDDSRSMADSHSVHLAFQALALVSQSLTRLEAGEISVCRFGEKVDFIHKFEDGQINEASGGSIIDAFQFDQKGTDVRALLRRSLQQLALARDNRRGSSADLWQLQIIISDGICQDLEDLRALLRKAAEQKVMIVFVVVDSLHQPTSAKAAAASSADQNRNSILSMNSVSYVRGKDGSLDLKMERYMDAFPFDYYVILRDVAALPDVLSETLRQFFERVSGE